MKELLNNGFLIDAGIDVEQWKHSAHIIAGHADSGTDYSVSITGLVAHHISRIKEIITSPESAEWQLLLKNLKADKTPTAKFISNFCCLIIALSWDPENGLNDQKFLAFLDTAAAVLPQHQRHLERLTNYNWEENLLMPYLSTLHGHDMYGIEYPRDLILKELTSILRD